ncbi:uncharacterized protein LOC105647174 [Jatropha curcas]|uniref:uncharacterized protein LOC105647174 n=1 Tax=Jatropha curcas TaxID=180498 RepID=UPI0005FAD792|nr:uncharacterized protein LOC105647174 [Jatropha curcas]
MANQVRVTFRSLDRFVGTADWITSFPDYKIEHLFRLKSYHCPLHLAWYPSRFKRRKRRPFRFEHMWLRNDLCRPIVENSWVDSSKAGLNIEEKLESAQSIENVAKQREIELQMKELLAREEIIWSQRSRVQWL